MAILARTGTFALPAVTGNFAVTGVGFKGVALVLWATPQTAEGFASGFAFGLGFAANPTNRCTVTGSSANAVGTTSSWTRIDNLAFLLFNPSGIRILSADFVSFDADGFTLNFTITSSGVIVHYLVLGGPDLLHAAAGTFLSPLVTGTQDITGLGFAPDCVLFLSSVVDGLAIDFSNCRFGIGAATASPIARWAIGLDSDSGQVEPVTGQMSVGERTDSCIATEAGVILEKADYVQSLPDGFRLNWITVVGTSVGRYHGYLALRGGQYSVGAITKTIAAAPVTQDVSTVPFLPAGVLVATWNRPANTAIVNTVRFSVGATSAPAQSGGTWGGAVDNVNPTVTDASTYSTKFIRLATDPATIAAEADLSTFLSTGWRFNWTTNDANADELLYLALGAVPGVTDPFSAQIPPAPPTVPPSTLLWMARTDQLGAAPLIPADEPGFIPPRIANAVYPVVGMMTQLAGPDRVSLPGAPTPFEPVGPLPPLGFVGIALAARGVQGVGAERIAALPLSPVDDAPAPRARMIAGAGGPIQWRALWAGERIAALPLGPADDELGTWTGALRARRAQKILADRAGALQEQSLIWTERIAALPLAPADEPGSFVRRWVHPPTYPIGQLQRAIALERIAAPPFGGSDDESAALAAAARRVGLSTAALLAGAQRRAYSSIVFWTDRIAALPLTPADEPGSFVRTKPWPALYPAGPLWTALASERIAALPPAIPEDEFSTRLLLALRAQSGLRQIAFDPQRATAISGLLFRGDRIAALPLGPADDEFRGDVQRGVAGIGLAQLLASARGRTHTALLHWADRIAALPFGGGEDEFTLARQAAPRRWHAQQAIWAGLRAGSTAALVLWGDRIAAPPLGGADDPVQSLLRAPPYSGLRLVAVLDPSTVAFVPHLEDRPPLLPRPGQPPIGKGALILLAGSGDTPARLVGGFDDLLLRGSWVRPGTVWVRIADVDAPLPTPLGPPVDDPQVARPRIIIPSTAQIAALWMAGALDFLGVGRVPTVILVLSERMVGSVLVIEALVYPLARGETLILPGTGSGDTLIH